MVAWLRPRALLPASATIPVDQGLRTNASAPRILSIERPLGAIDILVLSAWYGLAGGLLEVGSRVIGTPYFSSNRVHVESRHFVWLASNVFLGCRNRSDSPGRSRRVP